MELKDEIQQILDDVLYPLGIHSHWKSRRDADGDEYVVYTVISQPNTEFANNKPLIREQNVDIKYYAKSEVFNNEHLQLIKDVMFATEWTLPNGERDIDYISETDTDGVLLEFSREQVI